MEQKRYIFPSFPERGEIEPDHIEAIVEVFPKHALLGQFFQICLGCRNNTEIERNPWLEPILSMVRSWRVLSRWT